MECLPQTLIESLTNKIGLSDLINLREACRDKMNKESDQLLVEKIRKNLKEADLTELKQIKKSHASTKKIINEEIDDRIKETTSINLMNKCPKYIDLTDFIYQNVDINYILNHQEVDWDWIRISSSKNIKMEDVWNNPQLNWNWNALSKNPNVTMKEVKNHKEINWNFYFLSENPGIFMKDVKENINEDWVWWLMGTKKDITIEDAIKINENKGNLKLKNQSGTIIFDSDLTRNIFWQRLSSNPAIKIKEIKRTKHLPWSYNKLSSHPLLTLEDVLEDLNKPWNWNSISSHPNITLDLILNNLNLSWDWGGVSQNPNIGLKEIKKHPEIPWSKSWISLNPNLRLKDILEDPEGWDWELLSINSYNKNENWLKLALSIKNY